MESQLFINGKLAGEVRDVKWREAVHAAQSVGASFDELGGSFVVLGEVFTELSEEFDDLIQLCVPWYVRLWWRILNWLEKPAIEFDFMRQ